MHLAYVIGHIVQLQLLLRFWYNRLPVTPAHCLLKAAFKKLPIKKTISKFLILPPKRWQDTDAVDVLRCCCASDIGKRRKYVSKIPGQIAFGVGFDFVRANARSWVS